MTRFDTRFRKHTSGITYAALLLFVAVIVTANPALGDEEPKIDQDLFAMSLRDLSNVTITSVSKKEEKLSEAAAAVFVLTSEDIERSGATVLPDVLRLVPGLNVALTNSSAWAVSSRGMLDGFANKLLILIDGRSIYTPLFAGVYWDVQNLPLENIDRIEVIRGPGASIWGANAVSGVINIITKTSSETEGTLITAGGGNETLGQAVLRHGFDLGKLGSGRVWVKSEAHDSAKLNAGGGQNNDAWEHLRSGFRIDIEPQPDRKLMVDGAFYIGRHDEQLLLPELATQTIVTNEETVDLSGGHLLTSFEEKLSRKSELFAQLYFDNIERDGLEVNQTRNTVDMELRHLYKLSDAASLIWGGGYRVFKNETSQSFNFSLNPSDETYHIWNAFVQFEQSVLDDSLAFTIGTKVSDNDLSGVEFQPTARIRFQPTDQYMLWAAVSRAVRTPSIVESAGRINFNVVEGNPPTVLALIGSDSFDSEELIAYETGLRCRVLENFTFDVSLYWNEFDRLATLEPAAPFFEPTPPPPHLVVPLYFDNLGEGSVFGGEAVVTVEPYAWWRLQTWFSYVNIDYRLSRDSADSTLLNEEGETPRHQAVLRSLMNLPNSWQLDTTLRYVDHIGSRNIDSYIELDARVGWQLNKRVAFSIVGTNLLAPDHLEFIQAGRPLPSVAIERAVFAKVMLQF